jgi:hypothetical protein
MRFEWAIPCLAVNIENGVITRMENANWDEIGVPALPAAIEFIALVRTLGQPDEFLEDAPRAAEANLTGPGMEGLVNLQFELPAGDLNPNLQPGWEVNGLVPIVVQFTAQAEGAHMLDLYLNSRYQRSIPFRVRIVEPPTPVEE